MNDEKKRTIRSVAGLVVLLLLCVAGIELIFTGLGVAIPKEGGTSGSQSIQADSSQSQPAQEPGAFEDSGTGSAQSAPSFCPFCGEGLPSAFQWGQYCPYCGEQIEN